MISAQCDELRAMAESVGLAVPQAATLMMEAADTILELRDDLQRANAAVQDAEHDESMAWDRVRKAEADADRLREELAKAHDPQRIGGQADPSSFVYAIEQLREFRWQHATNDEDAIPYINNVVAARERENAKLRMLIDLKETCWKYVGWCDECPYNGVDDEHGDCNCTVREKVNSLARELGVEVDR